MAGRERSDVSFYLTAYFVSGSSAFRRVTKMPTPAIRDITPRIPAAGLVLCSTFGVTASVVPLITLFGVIEKCLKAKQDNPENSQGEPVNLAELHKSLRESLLVSRVQRALLCIDQSFRPWLLCL
jgi:hypothetical protein